MNMILRQQEFRFFCEGTMTQTARRSSIHLTRRSFLAGAAAAPLLAGAATAAELQLDGLYSEPWLFSTSRDLSKDFTEAAKSKKNFVIVWEMRGCGWCKRLHLETFASDNVARYLQDNFAAVQLNLRGKQLVTDFDGEKLSEEDLSLKRNVNSTPTFQFFKPSDARIGQELGRAGFLPAGDLLKLLRYIREKGYEHGKYEEWVRQQKDPS